MTILDTATVLMQSKNYSGSGDWLDESGNGHDAAPQNSPTYAGGVFTLDSVNQFFYIADHADLDFAAAESFTAIALVKPSGTVVGTDFIVSKKTSANDTAGWAIYHTSANVVGKISDGTEAAPYVGSALSVGSAASVAFVRNVADDDIELFYDGTGGGSPVNDDTTGSLATGNPVHLGAQSPSAAFYFLGDYIAFALWRSALTDAQVLEASYYLTNGEPSVAVSGTAVAGGVTEGEIIVGGETIILTLTNDTWHANMGTDDASTTALIAGLDSGGAEAAGWDAVVKANMVFGDITRTSDTVVTIILAAEATYSIIANETVTATIPAAAINGPEAVLASPTFAITAINTAANPHNLAGPGQLLRTGG